TRFSRDWSSDVCSSDLAASTRIEAADQALALAEKLKASISDPGYRAVLNEVGNHIAVFNGKLGEYTELLAKERQVYAQMRSRAELGRAAWREGREDRGA